MTTSRLPAASAGSRILPDARGFTLIEVLISLGIIVGALAGIAALLPAAGSRLADATDIDRAGVMAANARADLANRGLVRASLWSGVTTPAVVFGEGLPALASTAPAAGVVGAANAAEVASRIDTSTGFLLQDSVQTNDANAVTGFVPDVCYGCMLSSPASPPIPGMPFRVSTVVFQKPGPDIKAFSLSRSGSSTTLRVGSGAAVAADLTQFLAGCSWVLAVGSAASEPRWVQVGSAWTAFAPGQVTGSPTGTSFVSLTGTDWVGLVSGGSLQVIGFTGLLRVDERFVNLE